MRSGHIQITADELVATLKHSSLPTLIVEGPDDAIVFRPLETRYSEINLSILPAGGRDNLLGVHARQNELANATFAFIADLDCWVHSSVPAQHRSNSIAFTSGYSIENDIFIDGDIEGLMSAEENATFRAELERFVYWYALALDRCLKGADQKIDLHPNHVLDQGADSAALIQLDANETYPEALRIEILADYGRKLRGKSLLDLAIRQLSYAGRQVRHHHLSLMEMTGARPGALIARLHQHVEGFFSQRLPQRSLNV